MNTFNMINKITGGFILMKGGDDAGAISGRMVQSQRSHWSDPFFAALNEAEKKKEDDKK